MSFQGEADEADEIGQRVPASSDEGDGDRPPYDDQTMLTLVRTEMQRSVGFENDQTLRNDRLRALDYYKGDMRSDIPSLPNRSKAVSTDISDAIETVLPDLMEIFTAGGDVVSFDPVKPGDEDAAKQETDYLQHVIFQENPGFMNLYEGFKDGLLLKTCVFEFGWRTDYADEDFTGKTAAELMLAHQSGDVVNIKADPVDPAYPNAEPTYSFTVRTDYSCAEYWSLPPDDFSVSPDTVRLCDTTYCGSRHRPRVQDLIAEGYDEDVVLNLEPYAPVQDQQLQQARDTAGEHQLSQQTDITNAMLRQVELRKHYIRLKDKDSNDFDIWRVVTNATADVVVPFEGKAATKMGRIPFSGGSPYPVAHRFYGQGLADQLVEIQKIKTVLTRALLDSSYFALNQRYEVAMASGRANDYTISDLLRNEPAVPVRSNDGNSVRPLASAGLGFDAYAALEYFSTVAEGRTGVVRNAQGLNPDTLHDTAKGAMALMQAAQRRVRMIARVLAETIVKDLYLGLHALIRENAEKKKVIQLNGKWVDVDPTQWGERNSMSIEVGLGASGKDADLAAYQVLSQDMMAIAAQGGMGTLITPTNIYNLAIDKAKALGRKQPERYFTDPSTQPPQQPQPDPKMMQAQAQLQLQQQKQQTDAALKRQQLQTEASLKKYQIDQQTNADIVTSTITAHAHSKEPNVGIGGSHI